MAGMPQTKINVCAGKGSKLVAWACPLLLIALGARPGFSQTRPTEKPFSLAHFRPEQIDINDRSPSLPKELVAIAGKNRGRSNDWIRSLSFSPDGKAIELGNLVLEVGIKSRPPEEESNESVGSILAGSC